MQHNGCITAALPLVSCLFVRSARAPPSAPQRMFSFCPMALLPPPHTWRESQNASPQGPGAGGASPALIVFAGSTQPRCVRFLHKYFMGRRAEIKASLSCRAVMIPRREHLNTPPPPLFSLGFLQCKHQALQRWIDLLILQ